MKSLPAADVADMFTPACRQSKPLSNNVKCLTEKVIQLTMPLPFQWWNQCSVERTHTMFKRSFHCVLMNRMDRPMTPQSIHCCLSFNNVCHHRGRNHFPIVFTACDEYSELLLFTSDVLPSGCVWQSSHWHYYATSSISIISFCWQDGSRD